MMKAKDYANLDAQKVCTGVENTMKVIQVVAAIIRDGDKILATQMGYGDFAGGWEFPGEQMENLSNILKYITEKCKIISTKRKVTSNGVS